MTAQKGKLYMKKETKGEKKASEEGEKNSFLRSIKGKLILLVAVCTVFIILAMTVVSSVNARDLVVNSSKDLLAEKAETNAEVMSGWLEEQSQIVMTMENAIVAMDPADKEGIMDYLEANLSENESALMYYLCLGYNGGVFPADHGSLDLDPSTRDWWTSAVSAGELIYTEPYMDFASGQMIVSIADPFMFNGEQAVVLADITLDQLLSMTGQISTDDGISSFLLAGDGSVILHENEEYLPNEEGNTILTDHVKIDLTDGAISTIHDYDGMKKYAAIGEITETGWKLGVVQSVDVINRDIYSAMLMPLLIGIILLIVTIVLLTSVISRQLKPMDEMKEFIKEKVIGRENCNKERSEVKEIRYLIGELEDKVITTIRKTSDESGQIQTRMEKADGMVAKISSNIGEISASMEETGASVATQTESIEHIDDTCKSVAVAVDELAGQAQDMAAKAKEIIEKVDKVVPELLSDKEHAVAVTENSKERLEEAIAGVQVINQITDVSAAIKGIAGKTNLLALNASIEAARAGEAGRGFAVVADQIKELSSTTSEEIEKVNALTEKVLDSVTQLSEESNAMLEFLSTVVMGDYGKLEQLADSYKEDASFYSDVSSNLGAGTEELSASVQNINELLSQISDAQEELNKTVQHVNENMQEITYASADVAEETKEVLTSVESLQQTVGTFHV